MTEKLSSRQLRSCGVCRRRKNLEWDGRREMCHDCLIERCDEVVRLHKENEMAYHEAEAELMERLRINRLEAETRLHPPREEWITDPALSAPVGITIGDEVVKWDDEGYLLLSDGRRIDPTPQEEE